MANNELNLQAERVACIKWCADSCIRFGHGAWDAWKERATRAAAPAQAEPSGALPELPEKVAIRAGSSFPKVYALGHTDDGLRAYAKQAIEARGALSDAEIDDMAFGYAPGGQIGELRELIKAVQSRILGQQGGGDAARHDARLNYFYEMHCVKPFIAPIVTKEKWIASLDAAIQAQAGDAPMGGA